MKAEFGINTMTPETFGIDRKAFDGFAEFMRERDAIRERKEGGHTQPWTDDKILKGYHFTNIRREDDRVSKFLFEEWYPHVVDSKKPEHIWAKIMVARFVNNPDSLKLIANLIELEKYADAGKKLYNYSEDGNTVFRSAYLQPEIKGVSRLDKIFSVFLPQLLETNIRTDKIQHAVEDLCQIKYFGEFIAGQMALDAIHIVPGEWDDIFTFAPIGPGSMRGLNRLRNAPLTRKLKRAAYDREISELHACPGMNQWRAFDLEHALCEWDKYERLRLNQGSYNRKRNDHDTKDFDNYIHRGLF